MTPEQRLKRIAKIYDTKRMHSGMLMSTHARHNLEGAAIDIHSSKGHCDAVGARTIARVCKQLAQIEKLLEGYLT